MDCLWSAATSLAKLQTFQRPAVRGQSSRHRRSLFVTAKSGAGAQCRREKPDTSPRPRTACLADDARHSGTPDPFLLPPRHNSASWINQVERWFAELPRKQLRRGVHTSTKQLEADIRAFIARHNEKPKPYRWTKSADHILASVKRFCQKTQQTLCSEL